jgi:hypothetical protein
MLPLFWDSSLSPSQLCMLKTTAALEGDVIRELIEVKAAHALTIRHIGCA